MRAVRVSLVVAIAACISGCFSYSNFQSAKLLQPGKVSITPSASYSSFHVDGGADDEIDDWVFDLQLRSGISPRFELGAPDAPHHLSDRTRTGGNECRLQAAALLRR